MSSLTRKIIVAALLAASVSTLCAKTLDFEDGVNIQAGFFNNEDRGNIPIGWDMMQKYDRIKTVRIEMEPDEGVSIKTMQSWIREANAHGFRVIATHHCYHDNGSDDAGAVLKAALWWKENYKALSEAGPFTINVLNEWGGHRQTPESFAAAYNAAFPIIREFYKGPIIVDIPGWGQETVTAAAASPLLKDDNIVLSIHIYTSAYVECGANHWMQPEDLVTFSKAVNRPVMIGEFGGMREGGADWRALVAQSKALGWTVLAWAWNGDGEGMNMVLPSWNDEHSPRAYYPSTYFGMAYAFLGAAPKPQFELSVRDHITLGRVPGSYTFSIHTNEAWSVSVEGGEGWLLDLGPIQGWGTQQITFRVAENVGKTRRTATVTVRCGKGSESFPINQDAKTE